MSRRERRKDEALAGDGRCLSTDGHVQCPPFLGAPGRRPNAQTGKEPPGPSGPRPAHQDRRRGAVSAGGQSGGDGLSGPAGGERGSHMAPGSTWQGPEGQTSRQSPTGLRSLGDPAGTVPTTPCALTPAFVPFAMLRPGRVCSHSRRTLALATRHPMRRGFSRSRLRSGECPAAQDHLGARGSSFKPKREPRA